MYDIGKPAYAAIVFLAIYATCFREHVVGGVEGTCLWGVSVGIAMLSVVILPVILLLVVGLLLLLLVDEARARLDRDGSAARNSTGWALFRHSPPQPVPRSKRRRHVGWLTQRFCPAQQAAPRWVSWRCFPGRDV